MWLDNRRNGMKRDMDLIRLILLEIENSDEEDVTNMMIDGYSSEEIFYNAKLMKNNNLIKICEDDILGNYYIGSLTWYGCDYLDKIRDNSNWKKVKDIIKEKALPMTFETVKSVATAVISAATEGAVSAYLKNGN